MTQEMKSILSNICRNPMSALFRLLWMTKTDPRDTHVADTRYLRNSILSLPDRVAECYREEIEFLQSQRMDFLLDHPFPYPVIREATQPVVAIDSDANMPYVMHRGKRLYYPAGTSLDYVAADYVNFVDYEGIVGKGRLKKHPHAYTTDDFRVDEHATLIDIGCSEGLFALDNVDRAGALYLFEVQAKWKRPLELTFQPFRESHQIQIVQKLVSSGGHDSVRLPDVIQANGDEKFFVKMDIEGFEREVLQSSREFFQKNKLKLSCCVYHRQDDERWIVDFLQSIGYRTKLSEGYMVTPFNGVEFPFFRHGVVMAQNY